MQISEKIKHRRKELGLTLEEVGRRCDTSKSTVRKWECGIIKNMRRDKIEKLAAALEVTPEYLMGWEHEITPPVDDWSAEFEDIVFTKEEIQEIINFARFLISKRK